MKRILSLLLAALLALSLCAGCAKHESAKAPAQATSRPAIGAAASAKAAGKTVSATPEASSPAELPEGASAAELPVPALVTDPAQTTFPGGLDDDGRGPDEDDYGPAEGAPGTMSGLVPVEFIPLEGTRQYEANVFLSNFAEQGINLYFYDLDMSQILPSLVDFAHIWCKINDRGAVTYSMVDGSSYEVLSFEKIVSVITRFVPLNVTKESAENYYTPQAHSFYQDGSFFFEAGDGEAYNRIAVADTLALLDDGRYCLTFTEYEVDLEVYFDEGIPRSYYELDPFSASQHQYLTRVRDGFAIVTPYQYNGRSTYQLVEYTTW